jgi:hypothetical protein
MKNQNGSSEIGYNSEDLARKILLIFNDLFVLPGECLHFGNFHTPFLRNCLTMKDFTIGACEAVRREWLVMNIDECTVRLTEKGAVEFFQ